MNKNQNNISEKLQFYDVVNFGIFGGNEILFSCGMPLKNLILHLKTQEDTSWYRGLKNKKIEEGTDGSAFMSYLKTDNKYNEVRYYIIMEDYWTGELEQYVTLAHEIIHIVQYKLIPRLNRDHERECEAYSHSHIMSQILNKIADATNKH